MVQKFKFPPIFLLQVKHPKNLNKVNLNSRPQADSTKLENLLARRKIYGDITQNSNPEDLEKLLRLFDNHVPSVIAALVDKVKQKGSKTYIPPAFYERNGAFIQPPPFEVPIKMDGTNEKNGLHLPPSTSFCLNCSSHSGQVQVEKSK